MHPLINPEFLPLLNVYSDKKPEFLLPFFQSPCIQRLTDISQSCGTNYTKLYNYKAYQSRLNHSLGVALIVWNFTNSIKATLAGFFHDVSNSVFSHVGDFLLGDATNQHSSEQYTTYLIQNDKIIMQEIDKLGIKLDEIDDYTLYNIADNPGPKLSADRLEYTLSNTIVFQTRQINELKEIYDNITILINEDDEQELGFTDPQLAEKLGILSIENDERYFGSYESVVAMSFLSQILDYMLQKGMVNHLQLYILKESEIIQLIQESADTKLRSMWEFFTNLEWYKIYKFKPEIPYYFVSSNVKKRYIDPLIKTSDGLTRLSEISKDFVEKRDYHLNKKQERISINYKL